MLRHSALILEKELATMHQTLEAHKRKTIESAQTSADLKLHLDRYHAQLKEVQELVAEKSQALERQSFKNRRSLIGTSCFSLVHRENPLHRFSLALDYKKMPNI